MILGSDVESGFEIKNEGFMVITAPQRGELPVGAWAPRRPFVQQQVYIPYDISKTSK